MAFGPEMQGNVAGSKYRARGAKGGAPVTFELLRHGRMSGTKHRRSRAAKRGKH